MTAPVSFAPGRPGQPARWTSSAKSGVDGPYVWIAPPEGGADVPLESAEISIQNRPSDQSRWREAAIISPCVLALVRFGPRAPADPRSLDTITVIDAVMKGGTSWWRRRDDISR